MASLKVFLMIRFFQKDKFRIKITNIFPRKYRAQQFKKKNFKEK